MANKAKGIRVTKCCEQKRQARAHQRKILAKLARRGVKSRTPLNKF